jgi:hypothetical protein
MIHRLRTVLREEKYSMDLGIQAKEFTVHIRLYFAKFIKSISYFMISS